jgi:hypothetical protein
MEKEMPDKHMPLTDTTLSPRVDPEQTFLMERMTPDRHLTNEAERRRKYTKGATGDSGSQAVEANGDVGFANERSQCQYSRLTSEICRDCRAESRTRKDYFRALLYALNCDFG